MDSWEIIKSELTKTSKPKTFGRSIDINLAADLFVKIMYNLTDQDIAKKSMNEDMEVRDAILARRGIEDFRKAGVLS